MKIKFAALCIALGLTAFASAQCTVGIPNHAWVIPTSQTLMAGGEVVWACQGASVTDMGGADTIFLEKNCSCISNGGGVVIYAKTGCTITLNGGSEIVIYEAGVNINNMGGAGQLTSCSSIIYNYSKAPVPGCTSTGISEPVNQMEIALYPNPASEFLTIELPKWNQTMSANIKISNPLGSVVFSSALAFNSGAAKIDVSNFPKGIYMLSVSCGEHRYAKLFIVK